MNNSPLIWVEGGNGCLSAFFEHVLCLMVGIR